MNFIRCQLSSLKGVKAYFKTLQSSFLSFLMGIFPNLIFSYKRFNILTNLH